MSQRTVLTDQELAVLRQVPTTKEQARTILKRNSQALEFLFGNDQDGDTLRIDVGCPHCLDAYKKSRAFRYCLDHCRNCAYNCAYSKVYLEPKRFRCLETMFGGVRYVDIAAYIELSMLSIKIRRPCHPQTKKILGKWLQGHVEWTLDILGEPPKKATGRPVRPMKENRRKHEQDSSKPSRHQ